MVGTTAAAMSVAKRRQQNRVTFKLSNVVVNAKAMMQAVDDMEPLAAVMPADADERCTYVHRCWHISAISGLNHTCQSFLKPKLVVYLT